MFEVSRYRGLQALPETYKPVFEHGSRESVFLSLAWFRNFERAILGSNEFALIYGVEKKGSPNRPMGALVLKSSDAREGPLAPRRVESLSNYYTSHFAPVMAEDCLDIAPFADALASALWADRRLWDLCRVQPLEESSPAFSALVGGFRRVGMLVQTYFCFGNWRLEVDGRSYGEYLATLPSALKATIRRKGKKLQTQEGVRIQIITDPERVGAAIEDYMKVYLASWKNPEPYPLFMPGLIRMCAELGWLRLGMVYVDGEPAATQLWIVKEGVASIYKLAYDRRFEKLSVGTLLTAHLMRHVIDVDGVAVVDYLTGDDAYKRDWMSHRTERWGILAFNPYSVRGITQAARHIGGRFLKRSALKAWRFQADSPRGSSPA